MVLIPSFRSESQIALLLFNYIKYSYSMVFANRDDFFDSFMYIYVRNLSPSLTNA